MDVTARYNARWMGVEISCRCQNPMAGHSGELRRGGTIVAPQLRATIVGTLSRDSLRVLQPTIPHSALTAPSISYHTPSQKRSTHSLSHQPDYL